MTEKLVASVPWGALAVGAAMDNDIDIEIVLLQQSVIDGQQKELSAVNTKLKVTQDRCVQLDTERSAGERRIKELGSELASTQERLNAIEAQGVSDPAELEKLEVRVAELEAELELANKTKDEVLERNYDQERKIEAARYQKDTTQNLFDEQRQELIKARSLNESLDLSNEALTVELKDANKYIKQIEDELAGVAERIQNAVATERARCEEAHSKETAELKRQLKEAQQAKGDVGAVRADANEKIQQLESDLKAQEAAAKAAGDLAISLEAERASMRALLNKEREMRENIGKGYAKQTLDYELCKRDNLTLAGMIEYMEMKKVWAHEDGTDVYIINLNPNHVHMYDSESAEGEQAISSNHPVFWIMNDNGTGHIAVLSEDASKLHYPCSARESGCKFKDEHEEAMLAAMQAMTIDCFNEAVERSRNYHYNVAMSAEFLDLDWSAAHDAARIIKAVEADPKYNAMFQQAKADADVVNRRAGVYQEKLKAAMKRVRVANKPKAKSRKKKR